MEWQPIATAPKMPTVLLFAITDTETGNWKMETGFWHDGYDAWRWGGHICHTYETQPTHWMPLPPPPAPEAGDVSPDVGDVGAAGAEGGIP